MGGSQSLAAQRTICSVIGNTDARASLSLVLGASAGVAVLAASTTGLAHVIERFAVAPAAPGLDRWAFVVIAMASGLFVAAGVLRLAKWRLVRDSHSALVGTALVVMGGLCLPLGSFARMFVPGENGPVIATAIRCVAAFIAMRLVILALHAGDVAPRHRPERALPRLFVLVILALLTLLVVEDFLPDLAHGHVLPPAILAVLLSLGWLSVALRVALHSRTLPWARRAAPLLLGMALAEMLRGLDLGRLETWTLGGVLLCASMAALATRSALMDLDRAVRAEQHQLDEVSVALSRATSEADQLTVWREQLTHDARNAFAGVRAAMEILERYDGRVDPGTSAGLRLAAAQEIGHLEHLVTRSAGQARARFSVSDVVRDVGECARALGHDVSVRGHETHGIGMPGDLDAVLRHLLANVQIHAAGSKVDIRVTTSNGRAAILFSDDGPGLSAADARRAFDRGYRGPASPGSGLGLWGARELMRQRGGDLALVEDGPGATFLLTLPASAEAPPALPVRVPAQRTTPRLTHHGGVPVLTPRVEHLA